MRFILYLSKETHAAPADLNNISGLACFRSDTVFMGPPSIAYYAAAKSDIRLLELSFTQVKLYREILQDVKTKTWRHILLGISFFV